MGSPHDVGDRSGIPPRRSGRSGIPPRRWRRTGGGFPHDVGGRPHRFEYFRNKKAARALRLYRAIPALPPAAVCRYQRPSAIVAQRWQMGNGICITKCKSLAKPTFYGYRSVIILTLVKPCDFDGPAVVDHCKRMFAEAPRESHLLR